MNLVTISNSNGYPRTLTTKASAITAWVTQMIDFVTKVGSDNAERKTVAFGRTVNASSTR
jgi:hypothetical protein